MPPSIRIQLESLDSLANHLNALRQAEWQAVMADLSRIGRALDGVWSSTASAAFGDAHGAWLARYGRHGAAMTEIERYWRSVAEGYRETEARLLKDVDASPVGASKVLARPVSQGPTGNSANQAPDVRFKLPADIAAQAISEAEAQRLFALLAADPTIAWGYPIDGCYARAAVMAMAIRAQTGHEPLRIWAYKDLPDDNGDGIIHRVTELDPTVPQLHVNTATPYGRVAWDYHVAPMLPVRGQDGIVHYWVLDPALSSTPLSTDDWFVAIHATGAVDADWTRDGQAPWGVSGSGYWPAADPVIPDHAERTNAFYNFCAANGLICAGVSPVTGQGFLPPEQPDGPLVEVPQDYWWP